MTPGERDLRNGRGCVLGKVLLRRAWGMFDGRWMIADVGDSFAGPHYDSNIPHPAE